ncbi:HAD family hydrolase [Umezawaea beigongshangensis]|uniref:HAD family hydrolase n=1 Tax=Umezawaea beigongshangensis TaxID=2780383 RepID=UPI0018F22D75|nr:HAD family hydrolase [Umezawaea beigongshangensis]
MTNTVVLDVDGTLVDTNYHHTVAWLRAFRSIDLTVPAWRVHRAMGMGGDKLVGHVAGDDVEDEHGDRLREAWEREFEPVLKEVQLLDGARELLSAIGERGWTVVLASSGKQAHVEHYVDLLGAHDLTRTSSDDVSDSKPAPDLLRVALDRAGGEAAVVIGDSVWDCRAADNADLVCVGLLTGGFGEDELRAAGAADVCSTLDQLRGRLDELPFSPV